ncbi:MAG: DUF5676 family membrane protein [Hyphomicrobiaceae bacterium]|nr:DUF5676 family membrane protein [Hyphomicrobiaceae bacterium]
MTDVTINQATDSKECCGGKGHKHKEHTHVSAHGKQGLTIYSLGMALGVFLAITFTLCVAFDLLFPAYAMYPFWIKLLPGFSWISPSSYLLGLAESFAYGWYVALLFVPLYRFFQPAR